jgi:hypothetical protein
MSTRSGIVNPNADAENSDAPEFIYDRKTILELGELLAESALNAAKQQLKAAKQSAA